LMPSLQQQHCWCDNIIVALQQKSKQTINIKLY